MFVNAHPFTPSFIVCKCRSGEAIREQAIKKRLQRKRPQLPTDPTAIYGPPDKQQHFDDFQTGKKKTKVDKPKIGSKVKAKYDQHWYSGVLTAYNKDIDQWTIYFEEDNYTDYIIFPDKDVKLQ